MMKDILSTFESVGFTHVACSDRKVFVHSIMAHTIMPSRIFFIDIEKKKKSFFRSNYIYFLRSSLLGVREIKIENKEDLNNLKGKIKDYLSKQNDLILQDIKHIEEQSKLLKSELKYLLNGEEETNLDDFGNVSISYKNKLFQFNLLNCDFFKEDFSTRIFKGNNTKNRLTDIIYAINKNINIGKVFSS